MEVWISGVIQDIGQRIIQSNAKHFTGQAEVLQGEANRFDKWRSFTCVILNTIDGDTRCLVVQFRFFRLKMLAARTSGRFDLDFDASVVDGYSVNGGQGFHGFSLKNWRRTAGCCSVSI